MEKTNESFRFLNVAPMMLEFESDVMKNTFQIRNTSTDRVAWRLRSNAPSSYIASPNCGFLAKNETVAICVEFVGTAKRGRHEHRFLLQAMKAECGDVDKRQVWLSDRAQEFSNMQHIRIRSTIKNLSVPSLASSFSSLSLTKTASDSDAIYSSGGVSTSSSGSDVSRLPLNSAFGADKTTGQAVDQKAQIAQLVENIRMAIDKKADLNAKNVGQINEIKRLEIELEKLQYSIKDLESAIRQKTSEIEEVKNKK